MSLSFYLHCVYMVHSRPLLGATIALNLVSWDLKKIFSSEMDKNDIYLGGASKQNVPKKCTHAPNIRIGSGLMCFGF